MDRIRQWLSSQWYVGEQRRGGRRTLHSQLLAIPVIGDFIVFQTSGSKESRILCQTGFQNGVPIMYMHNSSPVWNSIQRHLNTVLSHRTLHSHPHLYQNRWDGSHLPAAESTNVWDRRYLFITFLFLFGSMHCSSNSFILTNYRVNEPSSSSEFYGLVGAGLEHRKGHTVSSLNAWKKPMESGNHDTSWTHPISVA